jgi:branched-chain amino acid transport system permease protein
VHSDAGKLLVALRDNEPRCAYVGLNVTRLRIFLLAGTAAVAGLAGWLYACSSGVVAPELSGFVFGTEIIIWVALGGRGTLLGPVIGAVAIDLASAYLSGDLPFLWKLLLGFAFIVVIVLLPRGLVPAIAEPVVRIWRRLRRSARAAVPALATAPSTPRAGDGLAVELRGVGKRFGTLTVLDDLSFAAGAGELVSIVGPNGAGKTTLMRCLSDGTERSAGTVRLNGNDIDRLPPHRCVAFGLGRKFQTANVFDTLTVAECLLVARARHMRPSWLRRSPTLELPAPALQVVLATGLDALLGTETRLLSHGQKQVLELAMVLALDPSVVLLDEPTAGLTRGERAAVGVILNDLARTHALCLLLVEHDLDFVRTISSRVVVLHQGRLALDGTVEEIVNSELVRAIYSGEPH